MAMSACVTGSPVYVVTKSCGLTKLNRCLVDQLEETINLSYVVFFNVILLPLSLSLFVKIVAVVIVAAGVVAAEITAGAAVIAVAVVVVVVVAAAAVA